MADRVDGEDRVRPDRLGDGFVEVQRASIGEVLDALGPLTVLAALPGWGRTTWMRQLRARIIASGDDPGDWIGSRSTADSWFDDHADGHDGLVFLDDVVLTESDPLWERIEQLSTGSRLTRFVVSTIDDPPRRLGDSTRVLNERELALTVPELRSLIEQNLHDGAADLLATVPLRVLQHPHLARRHLERLTPGPAHDDWPSPEGRLELSLLTDLQGLPSYLDQGSVMVGLLKQAGSLRRFSPDMIGAEVPATPKTLAAHFSRLEAYPFGTVTVDDETGQNTFEWSEGAWRSLLSLVPAESRRAHLLEGLNATRRAGQLTMQVYYLVQFDDFATVETLVHDHLRLFLIATNEVTYRALLDAPWERVSSCPDTLLLLGELHVRRTGSAASVERYFARALDLIDPTAGRDAFDTFRLTARRVFAAVSLGMRDRVRQGLNTIVWLLGDATHPGLLRRATEDAEVRDRLAAELYLPFWAATQLDDHALAGSFAELMRVHANPSSPTAIAERLTALAQEVFCGTNDRQSLVDGMGHTDPLLYIEAGQDEAATELMGMLAARRYSSPSRSAMEALTLLVRALAAPQQLHRSDILETLTRSTRFWRDNEPSTFQAAAAAVAFLALRDVPAARHAIAAPYRTDWFILAADALLDLATQAPSSAMLKLERATRTCDAPRAQALIRVLTSVGHLQLGRHQAATANLAVLVQQTPAGLARFALRFVSPADFDNLAALDSQGDPQIRTVLDSAREDARHLARTSALRLTPAEREILILLRAGRTNADIARERVVSINTVRTQLRQLVRKLSVDGRLDAVVRAEQLQLFEPYQPPSRPPHGPR